MNRRFWYLGFVTLFALLLSGGVVVGVRGAAPQDVSLPPSQRRAAPAGAVQTVYTPTTIITVTSTSDPDTSLSYKCSTHSPCTLRRAIVEANGLSSGDRPILIKFNIPTSDTGYISVLDVWKIELAGDLPEVKYGEVIIDGDTQGEIGGRTDGPKIIIDLYLGDELQLGYYTSHNDNIVRALAFQEGGIYLYSSNNIVEYNWVGLTDDGEEIYYVDDDPTRFNYASISGGGDSHNNTIRNNVVASSKGESIVVQGDGNVIVGNYVGTRADGTIDDVPLNRRCHPDAVYYNWFTGDGIRVSGDNNRVGGPTVEERNVIAGMLFASQDPHNSPPYAIEVFGKDNTIQNNYIGKDANGKDVWVCGYGIYVNNSYNQFVDNTIVNAGVSAIGIYGSIYNLEDGITLRGNVIENAPYAIEFGPTPPFPTAWKNFNPAQVTQINGTSVSGTAGDGSPCAECVIELFLDDGDDQVEALQSVAVVTAAVDGTWTATLTASLPPTRGLRTTSTTADPDQISGFAAGTTSKLSELYSDGGVTPPPTPTPTPIPTPPPIPTPTPLPTPEPPLTYATVLTVTTTADPDNSSSYTCYSDPLGPPAPAPDGKCTLRRAIVEASSEYTARPVLIKFNIPTTDTGYIGALDAWKIELIDDLLYVSSGQVTIDGETQREISGRADGPPIIVKLHQNDAINLGEIAGDDENIARGLAIQEGYIGLVGDWNIVENCWVGLSDDGTEIYYIDDDPTRFNYATISGGGDNNLIKNNVSSSSKGVSINLEGDENVVVGNYVGTRADGTIADVPINRKCHPDAVYLNWFTGDGIHVFGNRNRVGGPTAAERNVIAGMLFASPDPHNSPPDGIEVAGYHNVIQNNYIGKDANGKEVGVCGVGIYVNNRFNQFLDNDIVQTGLYAFGIYGDEISLDAITLRGNTFKEIPTAIQFGPTVPISWTIFNAAQITDVVGTTVYGTAGDDSPCPYCKVELFLDDGDEYVEALRPITVVTATADGSWTATLTETLPPTRGLRTASTSSDYDQIPYFEAGTTTDFSDLYPSDVTPPPPPPTPTPVPPPDIPTPTPLPTPEPPLTYATVLTITTTADPDNSSSYTCYSDPLGPPAPAPDGKCTLRRAIVEASSEYTARPVLIKFNIPTTDTGYIGALDAWKIELIDDLLYVASGQVIIDGETQREISGRADGPPIIVKLHQNDAINLGEIAGDDENIARGLAIQEGYIGLVSDRNIVENCWVGLSDDGTEIYYIDDDPTRFNYATISGGGDNNLIKNNVSSSSNGVSINLGGDDNVIVGNYVGTRADGTIADVPMNRKCHPDAVYYNWFTGDGMHIGGNRNRVGGPTAAERNVIAGMLFASPDPDNTPPDGLEITGHHNVIQNNYIGKDANGKEVGVCGVGIYVNNRFNQFLDNHIVQTGLPAFEIYGSGITLDAITLQGNVVKDVPSAIEFGPTVPITWTNFNAAQITGLVGTAVNGTSGADSPCPYCKVELFLDDGDEYVEALRPITVVTATADGSWTATLTETLAPTQGLRTASTTSNFGVIEDFEIGTTTDFADIYPSDVTPPDPPPEPTPIPPPVIPTIEPLPTPEPPPTYSFVLTVTTTEDPDTSLSYTCYGTYSGGYSPAPDGKCTLRRAIIEAGVGEVARPVLVKFNIPGSDAGHDDTLNVWRIELGGNLRSVKSGQVTIDGETQAEIGGRDTGPKIIVELYAGDKISLGEIAGEDDNIVRGLALQEGYISVVGDRNIVENCWVGLSDDGQEIHYISGNPAYANYATISGGSDNNLVQDNVVATSIGVGIDLSGDDNVVIGNYVGTRADGTLPDIPQGDRCVSTAPGNWWTGVGIDISGDRNRVGGPTEAERNVIAGMLSPTPSSTPPEAMRVTGDHNLIQNNTIGQDANGQDVWVCGAAMDLDGAFNQVLSNTIVTVVDTGWYAFGIWGSDTSLDALTLRRNVIENVYAIEYGPNVPNELEFFNPGIVTVISDTHVTGISDDDCPYCFVDVYLDDEDDDAEALSYLGSTTATVNGDWSITMTTPLTEGYGLRTVSTVRDYGVIENFEAGTSSKFSILFKEWPPTAPSSVEITSPTGELWTGEEYGFVASVSPVSTTLPITYVWQATGQVSQTVRGGLENDASFSWDSPDAKGVTVTASNAYDSVTASVAIVVQEPPTPEPLLVIGKIGQSKAIAQSPITYTLTVTNSGTATANDLVISDTVPVGATFGQALDGGQLIGSDVVSWAASSLAGGDSILQVRFVVTATETITNVYYRVSASGGYSASGTMPVVTTIGAAHVVYLPLVLRN